MENILLKLKNGESLKIVALGDSLTQGWMVRMGYIDFVDEMLKKKYPNSSISILNRGIPGDTADGGIYRLRRDVLDVNPDLVLIQFALNDAFMGISPGNYKRNIEVIIEKIRNDTSSEMMLVTSVPIINDRENQIAEEFYNILIAIAENESLPIALVHEYWKKMVHEGVPFPSLIQADGVHPNIEGHRIMAEAVMELF